MAAVGVMVYWPRFKPNPPRERDAVERIAGSYLDALTRQDDEAAKKLGTIEEPPAIRSVRGVVHQKVRDRRLKGSFAPLAVLHTRIDADFTYDTAAGRFTPKNALGIAGETLDLLHEAKDQAKKSGMYEKMQSGDPNDIFDAAEQYGKMFEGLSKVLEPKRILPTYKMLIESAKPPLPEDAKALALEVAESPQTVECPAQASFLDAQAGWPVRLRGGRGDGDRGRPPVLAGRPAVTPADEARPVPARRDRHRLEGRLGAPHPAGR